MMRLMILLLVGVLILGNCGVSAQRGGAMARISSAVNLAQTQSESSAGWSAPAGAGVSLAGAEYRRNHPQQGPEKVVLFNGCVHGSCESSVIGTINRNPPIVEPVRAYVPPTPIISPPTYIAPKPYVPLFSSPPSYVPSLNSYMPSLSSPPTFIPSYSSSLNRGLYDRQF